MDVRRHGASKMEQTSQTQASGMCKARSCFGAVRTLVTFFLPPFEDGPIRDLL